MSLKDSLFNTGTNVLQAIDKPSASARSLLYNAFAKDDSAPAVEDIMKGRATFGAREFINKIEDATGLDITSGGRAWEEQTKTDVAINTVRDIAVDIVTSPETYLLPMTGGLKIVKALTTTPARAVARGGAKALLKASGKKLLKPVAQATSKDIVKYTGSNVLKKAAETALNINAKKAARIGGSALLSGAKKLSSKTIKDRIAIGTAYGALSINEGDTFLEGMTKIGTGTLLGAGALPALKLTGKVGQQLGGQAVDALFNSMAKDVFKNVNTAENVIKHGKFAISKIGRLKAGAASKRAEAGRRYIDAHTELKEDIIKEMVGAGFKAEDITKNLNTLELLKGGAFSNTTTIRNSIRDHIAKTIPNLSHKEAFNQATEISNKLVRMKVFGRDITEEALKESRTLIRTKPSLSDVTDQSNVLNNVEIGIIKNIDDPIIQGLLKTDEAAKLSSDILNHPTMRSALKKTIINNRKLVDELNLGFTGKGQERLRFNPLDFHTVDLAKVGEESLKSSNFAIKEGAYNRVSDILQVAGNKETREMAMDLGALNYANLTLTEAELIARKAYTQVYKHINDVTAKKVIGGFSKKGSINNPQAYTDAATLGFKSATKMTNFLKTNQLVTSTNWLVNNYPENVFKAYMASGSGAAFEAAMEVPAGLARISADLGMKGVNALSRKTGLGFQLDRAKAFQSFDMGKTFQELLKVRNPKHLRKIIDYSDDWANASSLLGVVENNRFVNLGKQALDDSIAISSMKDPKGILEALGGKKVQSVALHAEKAGSALERYTTALWNGPIGRMGGVMEDSMRMVTFRRVLDSLQGKYSSFDDAMKIVKGNPTEILKRTDPDRVAGLRYSIHTPKELKAAGKAHAKIYRDAGIATKNKMSKEQLAKVESLHIKSLDQANVAAHTKAMKKITPLVQARKMMEEAASITSNAFFDYSNVSEFEQNIMKIIFPYWTFSSKSAMYMADKMFDPAAARKIMMANKVRTNLGRTPTDREREGMPEFLLNQDARMSHDGRSTTSMRNFSPIDTASLLSISEIFNRMNPLIKVPLSIVGNKNFFTGGDLRPSIKTPKVRIFESKETLLPDKLLEMANVFRNRTGKLYTNSGKTSSTLEITRNLLPYPALDAIARAIKGYNFDGDKSDDFLDNVGVLTDKLVEQFLSPVKSRKIDHKAAKAQVKRRRSKNKVFEAETKKEIFPTRGSGRRRPRRPRRPRRSIR